MQDHDVRSKVMCVDSRSNTQSKGAEIVFLSLPSEYSMADEWYEIVSDDHFWIKWRFEVLRRILPKDYTWGETLEIGCGNGIVIKQIRNFYGCAIAGCDLSIEALRNVSPCFGPLYFYNIHQRRAEFEKKFSTILLMDVLEHIKNPIHFLESVNFHLKDSGRLIINVPAFQFFYSAYDRIAGHVKRYNLHVLRKELDSSGFCIDTVTYWGISMIPLLLMRKLIIRFYTRNQIIKMGFKSPAYIVDLILQTLMKVELAFSQKYFIGTSLLAIVRKK